MEMQLPQLMVLHDSRTIVKPNYPLIMHDDGWLWTIVKYRDDRVCITNRLQRWMPLTGQNLVVALMSGLKVELE